MKNKTIMLIGSSRRDGNTWSLIEHINSLYEFDTIDLTALNITYYDYQHANIGDDFIRTIEKVLRYDTIGFVSPVYWYTVSAQMKTFIDRISDLLSERKDLGRALAGKNTFLIATGATDEALPQGMEDVIKLTSKYIDMNFQGSFYAKVLRDGQFSDGTLKAALNFINDLSSK